MTYSKYIIAATFCVLLTSCMISKKYQRPELNMPEQYRTESGITHDQDTLAHQPRDFFKNGQLLVLLDSASVKNSDLLIAVQNIALAEKTLSTVKLNYLPELNTQISGSYGKLSGNSIEGGANGQRKSKDFNLSAVMNRKLDIWGQVKLEKEEALANYLRTHEVRKAVQTKMVADIAKGYYNLLMLDEQLEIAAKSMELSDSTLQMMRIQYHVDDADMLGVRQVEAQLESNKLLISQIRQSISVQENALSVLCGNYAGSISRRWDEDDEFHAIPSAGYPAALLSARPDIRAAELSLQAANARAGIQQVAMYPNINISLSGGLKSLTASNWFSVPASLFGSLTGDLTQPVFQRKKLRKQYEIALLEREKEVITFRQAVLEGYAQVSDALKNKDEIEKQFIFAENREKTLEDNISLIRVLFTTGTVSYLDIITVQSSYLEAKLQTAQLSMEKALANIELYHALGGGWEEQNSSDENEGTEI